MRSRWRFSSVRTGTHFPLCEAPSTAPPLHAKYILPATTSPAVTMTGSCTEAPALLVAFCLCWKIPNPYPPRHLLHSLCAAHRHIYKPRTQLHQADYHTRTQRTTPLFTAHVRKHCSAWTRPRPSPSHTGQDRRRALHADPCRPQ